MSFIDWSNHILFIVSIAIILHVRVVFTHAVATKHYYNSFINLWGLLLVVFQKNTFHVDVLQCDGSTNVSYYFWSHETRRD